MTWPTTTPSSSATSDHAGTKFSDARIAATSCASRSLLKAAFTTTAIAPWSSGRSARISGSPTGLPPDGETPHESRSFCGVDRFRRMEHPWMSDEHLAGPVPDLVRDAPLRRVRHRDEHVAELRGSFPSVGAEDGVEMFDDRSAADRR